MPKLTDTFLYDSGV